jgi:hypothetical protein
MPPIHTPEDDATRSRLGVAPGCRVWLGGHNRSATRRIEPLLGGAARPPGGPVDLAFVAPRTMDEAIYFAEKIRSRLAADGRIWIVSSANAERDENTASVEPAAARFDRAALRDAMTALGMHECDVIDLGDAYRAAAYAPRRSD